MKTTIEVAEVFPLGLNTTARVGRVLFSECERFWPPGGRTQLPEAGHRIICPRDYHDTQPNTGENL